MRGFLLPELKFLYVPLAALLGLLIGSFLNVCIYRLPRDLSVVSPRSFCPACNQPIRWYDNVPLVSFFLLRRKCRNCDAAIGIRYPVVELAAAILFALTAFYFGLTIAALKWAIFESLLLALFFTDLEERLLPDEFTLGGLLAGLAFAPMFALPSSFGEIFLPRASWRLESLLSAGLGAALLTFFAWAMGAIFTYILKRPALGLGDVKLLAMIGAFLGLEQGISAMLIASLGGSLVGVGYLVWTRKDPRSYQLPFGTFCCVGAALVPFLSIGSHFSGAVR